MTPKKGYPNYTHHAPLIIAFFWHRFERMIGDENPLEAFEAMINREREYRKGTKNDPR